MLQSQSRIYIFLATTYSNTDMICLKAHKDLHFSKNIQTVLQ